MRLIASVIGLVGSQNGRGDAAPARERPPLSFLSSKYTRFLARLPDQTSVLSKPRYNRSRYKDHIYKKLLPYKSDMGDFHV